MKILRTPVATALATMLLASPAAVAAQDAPDPVEFTTEIRVLGGTIRDGTVEIVDGVYQDRGRVWQLQIMAASDPRFDGSITASSNSDAYGLGGIKIRNSAFTIENEGGTWEEIPNIEVIYDDGSGSGETSVFVGKDGYEGLFAIAGMVKDGDIWRIRGVIVEGALPPTPDHVSPTR